MDTKIEMIKEHMEEIMRILEIPITESNEGTPLRIAKMWCNEVFLNRNNNNIEELVNKMKLFPNEYGNEVIIIRDIEFNSMCEHHWLPFSGKVTVAYIPKDNVIGLSKIPRVVKFFSRKPTLQEKLGQEIGDFLRAIINPILLVVYIKSTHSCVKCRGAESDCETVTTYSKYETIIDKQDAEYKKLLREYVEKRVGDL